MDHPLRCLVLLCVLAAGLRADPSTDLVRIHTEMIGGAVAVNALKSLRATGVTKAEGKELRFILWAARPNHIRTEITAGGRTLTQGWDGETPPWLLDSKTGKVSRLTSDAALEFAGDAEFDDPLVAGPDRRVALDYRGEVKVSGRLAFEVIVTQNSTEMSYLYIDHETYQIFRRDLVRQRATGNVTIRTEYSDYRPVAGVLQPFKMVVSVDGKVLNETTLDRIEPNPVVASGWFKAPPAKVGATSAGSGVSAR